jgi:hypothetical protein
MTGSEKAGVEVMDILGNNKGDNNRVNKEETMTMVNKAKNLESGPGKLYTTISRHAAQQKIEKNCHGHGVAGTNSTEPLGATQLITQVVRRRSENLKPYKRPHSLILYSIVRFDFLARDSDIIINNTHI